MSDAHGATASHYYVPAPSNWPMVGMISMIFTTFGAAMVVNQASYGGLVLLIGFALLVYMMVGWFGAVVAESEAGNYNRKVDISFRWGMGWFIFSEVMFFGSFFGALFYARLITLPALGDFDHKLLWPDFTATWPHTGPGRIAEDFSKIHAWPLPTINTILLVTSGIWLTIAHHGLRQGNRGKTAFWLFMTLLFGFTFVGVQAYEYAHAYSDLNLRLDSGIFGSTFFMLTGFHGFHVLVGAIMLTVVLLRVLKGHFKPDHHFAFEAAAWYWHFVDVVWIGLYVIVYWL
ncbi:MAG TPA: cytochrome c oxidase subunit 3 [Burkholderiaceae bacterium]|nr:cytochrome c oxidase subunit 3 [Burkholderiaceae bacterium]